MVSSGSRPRSSGGSGGGGGNTADRRQPRAVTTNSRSAGDAAAAGGAGAGPTTAQLPPLKVMPFFEAPGSGVPVCGRCFKDGCAPACGWCGAGMVKFVKLDTGEQVCAAHVRGSNRAEDVDFSTCFSCGVLCNPARGPAASSKGPGDAKICAPPGVDVGGNRALCMPCHASVVRGASAVARLRDDVCSFFVAEGIVSESLAAKLRALRIDVVTRAEMDAELRAGRSIHPNAEGVFGITLTAVTHASAGGASQSAGIGGNSSGCGGGNVVGGSGSGGGSRSRPAAGRAAPPAPAAAPAPVRTVERIAIIEGLPSPLAASVLAHELGHAVMFLSAFPKLAPAAEEGVCECFAHVWLTGAAQHGHGSESDAARFLRAMQGRNDRVYGGGYRKARNAMHRLGGLRQLLRGVKAQRTIPK
jgi:hypothetical protein